MASSTLFPEPLPSLELFAGLSSAELARVLKSARVRQVTKDTRIFHQGDAADWAYILIEGSIRITQSGNNGEHVIIRFIGPGETFGTVALFTDHAYPADADTLDDAVIAGWRENDLRALMLNYPQIALNVIHVIGKRLQEVQDRVRELSTQRVEQRVARAVLRLAHQSGQQTADGMTIEFPLRRKDVADISGTTLHTASRILSAWEKAGLLISENQRLTICNLAELSEIGHGGVGPASGVE